MAITDDYKHNGNDDNKEDNFKGVGRVDRPHASGRLAQTVTVNPPISGRTKIPLSSNVSHDLSKPTLLVTSPKGPQPSSLTMTPTTIPRGLPFGGIKITLVATSSTPCHFLTVDVRGVAYGWGRKKYSQPGSLFLFSSLS